jgi:hypothetical protein
MEASRAGAAARPRPLHRRAGRGAGACLRRGRRRRPLGPARRVRLASRRGVRHPISHDIRGRACATGRLCSEGVADPMDGNRKGSTSEQTLSTARNPAQAKTTLAPRGRDTDGATTPRTSTPETNNWLWAAKNGEPSVGLEPTTPSLPWKDGGVSGVHRCSPAGTKCLQIARSRSERSRRPKTGRGETGGRNVDGKPATPRRRISRADLGLTRLIVSGPLGPPDAG